MTLPIRIITRVDYDDGSSREEELRTENAAVPPQGLFWPEGVVTKDVARRMEYDLMRQKALGAERAEVTRLRQVLWDIYAATGADTDGDVKAPGPDAMTPDVPELALEAVRELRREHEDCE